MDILYLHSQIFCSAFCFLFFLISFHIFIFISGVKKTYEEKNNESMENEKFFISFDHIVLFVCLFVLVHCYQLHLFFIVVVLFLQNILCVDDDDDDFIFPKKNGQFLSPTLCRKETATTTMIFCHFFFQFGMSPICCSMLKTFFLLLLFALFRCINLFFFIFIFIFWSQIKNTRL